MEMKIKCKCGHTIIAKSNNEKWLCSWCGYYIFRNEKTEFIYRIKESLNKNKKANNNI